MIDVTLAVAWSVIYLKQSILAGNSETLGWVKSARIHKYTPALTFAPTTLVLGSKAWNMSCAQ